MQSENGAREVAVLALHGALGPLTGHRSCALAKIRETVFLSPWLMDRRPNDVGPERSRRILKATWMEQDKMPESEIFVNNSLI